MRWKKRSPASNDTVVGSALRDFRANRSRRSHRAWQGVRRGACGMGGQSMEGKGFVFGLALLVVVLAVLFGVAMASGTSDDAGNDDCVSQEYC